MSPWRTRPRPSIIACIHFSCNSIYNMEYMIHIHKRGLNIYIVLGSLPALLKSSMCVPPKGINAQQRPTLKAVPHYFIFGPFLTIKVVHFDKSLFWKKKCFRNKNDFGFSELVNQSRFDMLLCIFSIHTNPMLLWNSHVRFDGKFHPDWKKMKTHPVYWCSDLSSMFEKGIIF